MTKRNRFKIFHRALTGNLLVVVFFLPVLPLFSQDNPESDKLIQKGNVLYKQKQYEQAEAAYKEVLDKEPNNNIAAFNRANSQFRQSKLAETKKGLDDVIMNSDDTELKGKAYYNQGVSYTTQKNLEASIDAYKNALRQNPNDNEARENLQKALMELKKRNPPPPKENKKNQQKKQQKQQPKMDQKEAEQRLKLLEQKEKEVQQRLQNAKAKAAAGQPKDW